MRMRLCLRGIRTRSIKISKRGEQNATKRKQKRKGHVQGGPFLDSFGYQARRTIKLTLPTPFPGTKLQSTTTASPSTRSSNCPSI